MAKTIPFKFCLLDTYYKNKDIRRFACSLNVLGKLTFYDLVDKLRSIYSQLYLPQTSYQQQPTFSLYYIGKQTLTAFFLLYQIIFLNCILNASSFINR